MEEIRKILLPETEDPDDALKSEDPAGFEAMDPSDPDYPTPEELAKLKGAPVGDFYELTDEEVERLVGQGRVLGMEKKNGLKLLK